MSPLGSRIEAALEQAVATGAVPGAVVAVTDRVGTVYAGAFGAACADEGVPLRIDALFRLASMTKPITSMAVLMLAEEGRVELDAPLAEYLPGYVQPERLETFDAATRRYTTRPAQSAITVRELLTHTSGYGYWFLDPPLLAISGSDAPDLFNPPFLMHEPGERFAYSTSTDMLGLIVEPVTGRPLEQFLAERIFTPLGMADTGYTLPAAIERLMPVHRREPGGGFAHVPNETAGIEPRGGGGLYASAHDYLCLLRVLLGEGRTGSASLLSPESARAMTTNRIGDRFAERQTTAYPPRSNDFLFMDGTQKFGFGVLIETRSRPGRRAAGSYGWGGILNSFFWVDPANGLGAVLMTQLEPFCDPAVVALLDAFERAVYAELVPHPGRAGARIG